MFEFFRLFGLFFTGLLTVYVIFGQRKRSRRKACVVGVGFFVVSVYVDCLFFLIMEGAAGEGSQSLLQGLGILISKCIQAAALMMGKVLMNQGQKTEEEETVDPVAGGEYAGENRKRLSYPEGLTLGVHLFFLILIPLISLTDRQHVGGLYRLLWMLFCLTVLLSYDVSFYFYRRRMQERVHQSKDAHRKRDADLYLKGVEDNYQRTRELWHDLKNHINLMNLLLQEKKYEQLGDYLRIFGEDLDSLILPVKSGNLVVDALLADKLGRAKRADIEIKLSLCDLTKLRLKPDEICSLFGNLLDNALEANAQVPEGRFLEVDCREREECYYIRIRNAAAGCTAKDQKGALQTGKSDRRNRVGHGLGIRSVERIVHSCGGEMTVESREKMFTVVVRLPR